MATLAEILRGYQPPTTSALADPIKEHFRTLPQQLATNQAAMDNTMASMYKTDFMGKPNPNYRPEAMNEFTQMMPMVGALTAWHGTPHKIKGLFDISKVGTGEGAQAYGHGMYFAEAPTVAKEYQRKLSGWDTSTKLALGHHGGVENAIAETEKRVNNYKTGNWGEHEKERASRLLQLNQKKLEELQAIKSGAPEPTGNLYKVDIPDEHIPMMLDYDKPIKDQPELYELVRSNIKDPDILKTFEHNAEKGITGANVYKNYIGGKTDADRSANALNIGIKGIRYKDAMSRSADEGTSNFVVFEPSNVKILEENGIPTRKELIQQQIDKIE